MFFDSKRLLAWRWTPWLFSLAIAIVARLVLPVDLADRGERYAYHAMSRAFPLAQCSTFHCFRFLPPLFASLPPLDVIDAFIVTGFVFQFLAGVMLWHLAARLSGSRRIALLTTAWYWVTWAPILSFTDPLLITDPVQAFWCFATLYLLLCGRDGLALAMLVVGAAVKESVLLVPMTYGVYVVLTRPRSAWRPARLGVLAAAPILAWLGLRAFLHAHHGYSIAGDSSYLRKTYLLGVWLPGFGPWPLNLRMAALYIFGTFGAGWIAGALGMTRATRKECAIAAGAVPAMVFLALYQVPDRALATYPYAVLIPAARYVSLLPSPFIVLLLLVNAALTIRMNTAASWLPSSTVLIGALAVLMAIGAWMTHRGKPTGSRPHQPSEPAAETAVVARTSFAVLAVAVAIVTVFVWRASRVPPVQRVSPPDGVAIVDDDAATPGLALSRDGRRLAFVGRDRSGPRRLWLQTVGAPDATALAGTDEATAPFWSPDGHWLGFFARGHLATIDVRTGHVTVVADAPAPRGGAWGADDVIVFAPSAQSALFQVPASGGAPLAVTTRDASGRQLSHRWPSFLPDGRRFVFTATGVNADDREVLLGSMSPAPPVRVREHAYNAEYADGYLLFVSVGGGLRAQPFDLRRGGAFGAPLVVASEVALSVELGRGAFTSSTSTLVLATTTAQTQLRSAAVEGLWVDRGGRAAPTQAAPPPTRSRSTPPVANESEAEVSPDGAWVAYSSLATGASEVFVRAYPLGGPSQRVSTEGGRHPHWRPDGGELFFAIGDRFVAGAGVEDISTFRFRAPRQLFAVDFPPGDSTHAASDFAVSPDGGQFFVRAIVGQQPSAPVFVMRGWRQRLRLP